MNKNLLKTSAKFHRDLVGKDTFTLEELSAYCRKSMAVLSLASSSIDRQYFERLKASAVEEVLPLTTKELDALVELVEAEGLETVLTALDLYTFQGRDTLISSGKNSIRDAQLELARLERFKYK